ncbi:MAG: DUF2922 domain-containing protein [Defluviitaleaceae bacterium]|nr:DUF2922 domain-containing protein [Defluviitaleaceae bacterium]MCL2273546.1 DUF2922 domain-containing protein [Defluviitaleaceae bacterium]
MKERIQLTFRTSKDANRVVSVSDPRDGLNEAAVRTAAGLMISANPFDAETGELLSLTGAQRVQVSTQVIIAPAAA